MSLCIIYLLPRRLDTMYEGRSTLFVFLLSSFPQAICSHACGTLLFLFMKCALAALCVSCTGGEGLRAAPDAGKMVQRLHHSFCSREAPCSFVVMALPWHAMCRCGMLRLRCQLLWLVMV